MNPWDIFNWIIVACLSLLVLAITLVIVRGMLRGSRKSGDSTTSIIKPTGRSR